MRSRSRCVSIIVHSIPNITLFTVHGTVSVTHQPQLGRTGTEFNCFRMHADDYATSCVRKIHSIKSAERSIPTVRQLVRGYKPERMPRRHSTSRSYNSWLDNYILPRWCASPITALKARPVEQWLGFLKALPPRSKGSIRGLVHAIWDYAMWSDAIPTQANPACLVKVEDVSKRWRQRRVPKGDIGRQQVAYCLGLSRSAD